MYLKVALICLVIVNFTFAKFVHEDHSRLELQKKKPRSDNVLIKEFLGGKRGLTGTQIRIKRIIGSSSVGIVSPSCCKEIETGIKKEVLEYQTMCLAKSRIFLSCCRDAKVTLNQLKNAYETLCPIGDVNECFGKPCDKNASCQNTIGSFTCTCNKGFTGDGRVCTALDGLSSSVILHGKPDYLKQLKLWLPSNGTWHLCWRASKDGWSSKTFHSLCDNKGPTVTIVSVGKYIFGGYADVSWKYSGGYVKSMNAFVFSLKNKDNLQPFIAPVDPKNSDKAIWHGPGYSPCFGISALAITDNANKTATSFAHLGKTYQAPPGYSYGTANANALLAGAHLFIPSEVEVFYLQ